MGRLVPLLAIVVSLLMLTGATRQKLLGGVVALIAGAALFIGNDRLGHWQRDARSNMRGAEIGAESDAV